jgi:hypothetical protein
MGWEKLCDQIAGCLRLLAPELGDPSILIDECLSNARRSFSDDFILDLPPQAWAKITIIYHKHFLDTESDVSVGEMVAEVVRDSIGTRRIDFLTQNLALKKRDQGKKRGTASQLQLVKK